MGKEGKKISDTGKLRTVIYSALHNQRGYFEPSCILLWVFVPLESPVRLAPDLWQLPSATRSFMKTFLWFM